MSKFKPGDIVRCLKDWPCGAGIATGDLAIVLNLWGDNSFNFDNYPQTGRMWAGSLDDFELNNLIEANE